MPFFDDAVNDPDPEAMRRWRAWAAGQGQQPPPAAAAGPAAPLPPDALAALMGGAAAMAVNPQAGAGVGPPVPRAPTPQAPPGGPQIYVGNGSGGFNLQDRSGNAMQPFNPGMSLQGGQSLVRDANDPNRTWVSQPPNPADSTPAMAALRQMLGLQTGQALPSMAQVAAASGTTGMHGANPYGVNPEQYAGLLQGAMNGPEGPTQAQARMGELGLRGIGLTGIGGIPGSLQTQAEQVRHQGIGQEYQFGPDSQFLAMWEQRRRDLIQNAGVPPEEADRMLEQQLGRRPAIMSGGAIGRLDLPGLAGGQAGGPGWVNQGPGIQAPGLSGLLPPGVAPPAGPPGGPPAGQPAPGPQAPPGQPQAQIPPGQPPPLPPGQAGSVAATLASIRRNVAQLHGRPGQPGPNGAPGQREFDRNNPEAMARAVSAYFNNPAMTDDFLRNNFQAVHGDAISQFGAPLMDQWFQQTFYPWSTSPDQQAQRQAIDRVMRARQGVGPTDLAWQRGAGTPAALGGAGAIGGGLTGGVVGSAGGPMGTATGVAGGAGAGGAAGYGLGRWYQYLANSGPANSILSSLGL